MDNQGHDTKRTEDYGDESLNTSSTDSQEQSTTADHPHRGGIHNNAQYAASMGRPATAQVNPHSNSDLANSGTNISYEGATAPGSGGSAGYGNTSGQPDAGSTISTSSDYDQAAVGKHFDKAEGEDNIGDEPESNEQR